ncbi:MAG: toll/interleukin-1 receptor domain-containing protein [Lentilitoribacter sp.]
MPIFISYSQKDSGFVDILAANLVRAKHHVWMDRWELSVGDSLTQKIEDTLTDSGAILVVLSKSSVESQWCKRELTAGLVRELEEQQTLVMPIVIDDCKIPLFLRDKLYADFRKNPDEAFSLIDQSLSRISNSTTSRSETPDWHTDFAVDWKPQKSSDSEETWIVRWSFMDHGALWPYSIISECKVYVLTGIEHYEEALENDEVMQFNLRLLRELVKSLNGKPLQGYIDDNLTKFLGCKFQFSDLEQYAVVYSYRRVGLDNGKDTVVHLDNNLHMALKHHENTLVSES